MTAIRSASRCEIFVSLRFKTSPRIRPSPGWISITCRNLLIYLGVPLQKKVLAAFHYALNPDGYLLLGSSETVEAGSEAFRQIDKKHKVYSRLRTSARPRSGF